MLPYVRPGKISPSCHGFSVQESVPGFEALVRAVEFLPGRTELVLAHAREGAQYLTRSGT
ncbi:MAG: hypothetical protein MI919_39635 [Holophagales bacterium]|nr:hypothetical protein [Holophagales bacterium]